MNQAAKRGTLETLQAAGAITGNGTALAIPANFRNHTMIIKGSAGISAGKVTFETADAPDYAGTWSTVGAETTAVASKDVHVVLPTGTYPALRARISVDIVGGTVTVLYQGY